MLYSTKSLILFTDVTVLWMVLKTFITENTGYALILIAIILGTVELYRIPQLPDEKISDNILKLFKFDSKDLKKNVIFHKGGAGHAPENTIEAVQKAAALGVPSVEIDLDFTKDGHGVVIHGPLVDDTTEGEGLVSNFTLEEIQTLNAAAKDANKDKYPVVRIPTLEAVIQECIKHNLVVFIDCKSNAKKTASLVVGLFKQYPQLYSSAVVCSFYPTIVYAVRSMDANIVTASTHRAHILTSNGDGSERNKEMWKRVMAPALDGLLAFGHWAFFWYFCGNSIYFCNKDYANLDNKNFWASLGVRIIAWTVNDPTEQHYLLSHLNIPIITDGFVVGSPVDMSTFNESQS